MHTGSISAVRYVTSLSKRDYSVSYIRAFRKLALELRPFFSPAVVFAAFCFPPYGGTTGSIFFACLHDPANVQQISSKRRAVSTCLLNAFAGRLLDRVNGVLSVLHVCFTLSVCLPVTSELPVPS